MGINRKLADQQGLNEETIAKIEALQNAREQLFIHIYTEFENRTPQYQLNYWMEKLTYINFQLQDLWGFDIDERYHRWYEIPHCSCPKMDNDDYIGTDMNIYSENCPFHGQKMKDIIKKNKKEKVLDEVKRWNEHDFRMIRNSYRDAIEQAMDKVSKSYND